MDAPPTSNTTASRIWAQCSRPSGWLGRFNLWRMNHSHASLTAWGLAHIAVRSRDTTLDVGCGGGRTIARLAAIATEGKTYGVDYSDASVAASRAANRDAISAGRVEILPGSVSQLPFPDQMFDVVTAVETHYYWPDLKGDFEEVWRVLKPGGTFVVIAESYRGGKHDRMLRRLDDLNARGITKFAHLSLEQHREVLTQAGYADIRLFEEYDKGWMCAVGKKRAISAR